jgi:membrane protease YdiL (CAAX protease family)
MLFILINLASGAWSLLAAITALAFYGALWLAANEQVPRGVSLIGYFVVMVLSALLFKHGIPGFHNLVAIDQMRFSPDSSPYTMHLNFDKPVIGISLLLIMGHQFVSKATIRSTLIAVGKTLPLCCLVLLGAATAMKLVRVDFKLPALWWLWVLNNLIVVVVTEELFFRGFLQGKLLNYFAKNRLGDVISTLMIAGVFGLAHFQGGLSLVLFATLAGIFYGWAFVLSRSIEAPVLVHFLFNLLHFLCFSYPVLERVAV